jgi:hypothetical protein
MVSTADAPRVPEGARPAWFRIVAAVGCAAALVPVLRMDLARPEFVTLFCWLAAMILYLMQWPRPRGILRWQPSPWLLAGLAAYALALFIAFCFVHDNWRWAVTGDSLSFYEKGRSLAAGTEHPLSVRGVFEQCTVIQATLQSAFMFISPTLFAHRLGNLLTSTLIVIAAALFAAQTSGAVAAILLALLLPVHSVFATFTLISYPNLTGLLPYWIGLALFAAALRYPQSGFLWAALGLTCGLAVYFLPLWLGAVGVITLGVLVASLWWRTPRPFSIWIGGVVVAMVPALLQIQTLLHTYFIFGPTQRLTLQYFLEIAAQTLTLALDSEQHAYGGDGPWMRPPFGYLFLAGALLAAASGVLALLRRPRSRALQHAWVWLVLYAGDATGLALQNSGYAAVSLKRAIVLLPAMTFLAVLPLAWIAERVARTWFTVTLSIVALAAFAALNQTTLWTMEFGYNAPDAMVRMTQTGPGKVMLVTRHEGMQHTFGAQRPAQGGDTLQELYQVRDRTIVVNEPPGARSDFDRVVCFSVHMDGADFGSQVRGALARLCPNNPPAQITVQLECVTCDPP